MKIAIWDCFGDNDTVSTGKLKTLALHFKNSGHVVRYTNIGSLKFAFCRGCMDCSFKSPGKCVFNDDGANICREYINADIVVMATPLVFGYISTLLKKCQERLFPLFLPYPAFESDGLMRLMQRYDRYPLVAMLYGSDHTNENVDLSITRELMERFARSFKSKLMVFTAIDKTIESIAHEFNIN